jgi:hypothetical protein
MFLTAPSIPSWLIHRGLLTPASIVNADFAVEELNFHNRGFRVYRPADNPLYVKQLREFTRPNVLCLEREAAFGKELSNLESAEWLASRVPKILDYDVRHHAITVQLIPATRNLHDRMEEEISIPDSVAEGIGEFIGLFYSPECNRLLSAVSEQYCSGIPPWILSFHVDQGDGSLSPANLQLLNVLQQDEVIASGLNQLRSDWHAGSLMHGDLKWNNVLTREAYNQTYNQPDWYVIDWEMVDRGDPLWDLATMVQCWWYYWILSTPPEQLTGLDDLLVFRRSAFEETRPSLNSLWSGFQKTTEMSDADLADTRRSVDRFAAARMIQTVYELLHNQETITPSAWMMIDLSRRIFEGPGPLTEFLTGARS